MRQAHLRGKGSHGVHREFIVGPLEINLRFIEHRQDSLGNLQKIFHRESLGDQQDVHNKLTGFHWERIGKQQDINRLPPGTHSEFMLDPYEINTRLKEHTQDSIGESIGHRQNIHNKIDRLPQEMHRKSIRRQQALTGSPQDIRLGPIGKQYWIHRTRTRTHTRAHRGIHRKSIGYL